MNPIKTIAKTVLPARVRHTLKYYLNSDYRDRCEWERDRVVGQWVYGVTGGAVVAGPFKGLKYVPTGRGSTIGPKLLGTYELELRDIIEGIIARGYRTVIDIGAGEGYYPVGLANRMPDTRFVCFDTDPQNQAQTRTLAELNGVADRLDIKGFCDDASLAAAIADQADVLVICDIEGAEVEVLRPDSVPALKRVDLLVEMHDIIRKGCSEALRQRFAPTHDIEVIPTRPRTRADFPAAVTVDPRKQLECMDEKRGRTPMTFFWMRTKRT